MTGQPRRATIPRHFALFVLAILSLLQPWAAEAQAGFDDGLKAYYRLDYQTALALWQPLAEAGHHGAQYQVGVLYYRGEGVEQDYRQAAAWFRRAAEAGDADAQFTLASMYSEGRGVPRSLLRAHMWFEIAGRSYGAQSGATWAAERQGLARRNRDWIASRLSTDQRLKADRLARNWKPLKKHP